MRPLRLFTALLVFLVGTGAAAADQLEAAQREAIERILALTDERLAVAPMVAESKWNSGAPISVPEREAQILDKVAARAADEGVEGDFARAYFQAQFEASKVVQTALHEAWRAEDRGPFEKAPDLAEDVRPLLDSLTPQIVEAMKQFQTVAASAEAAAYLKEAAEKLVRNDADGEARAVAVAPLEARLAP